MILNTNDDHVDNQNTNVVKKKICFEEKPFQGCQKSYPLGHHKNDFS